MTDSYQLRVTSKAGVNHTRSFGIGLAILTSCLLMACTQQQIVYQAIAHNRAISSSADEILLTNILRASKNMAIDYTAISGYQAKGAISGSVSPKVPFGGDAMNVFSIDPVLNFSDGITSIEVNNFGHEKKSYELLHASSTLDNFARRLTAGWDSRLIVTFFLSRITVRGEFWKEIYDFSTRECSDQKDPFQTRECRNIEAALDICGDNYYIKIRDKKIPEEISIVSNGSNQCKFAEFQDMLSRLIINGVTLRLLTKSDDNIDFKRNSELEDIYRKAREEYWNRNLEVFEVGMRSTDDMIKYLGQLVQSQLRSKDPWMPGIYLGSSGEKRTPIFLIERGALDRKSVV